MKNLVTLVFVTLIYTSAPAYSSCKSDLKKVAGFSNKAVAAKKRGDTQKARYHYKRAARKLSAMKYTCSKISLSSLLKKEKHYRALAAGVSQPGVSRNNALKRNREVVEGKSKPVVAKARCGAKLPRARQLIAEGSKSRHRKRKANYAAAKEILVKIKGSCRGSAAALSAGKLLARIRKSQKARSENTSIAARKSSRSRVSTKNSAQARRKSARTTRTTRTSKAAAKRNRRIAGQHATRNSCEVKKLGHIYTAEQQAYKALKKMEYALAADRFIEAIQGYENNSHKCSTNKSKLAVLDRADRLTKILRKLKREHIHCAQRLDGVREMSRTAYNDENSGELDLAQEGYSKAVKGYETMPQVCASNAHSKELNENRAKRDLLACKFYIAGIKEYNKAFSAVSKARNQRAATAYRKAAVSFNLAINQCAYNARNIKVLRKLKTYSQRSIKRLGKR